ncbi:MAG: hypothetical protein K2X50_09290 [Gammaproteobacteria bacterium]|nr:hypothetical protein [Gammaproteobacteria bacterium]
MKKSRPSSPRGTKGAGLQSAPLSELLSIIPNLLPLLPNDQIDNDAQSAEMASLWNFDFRDKKIKKLDHTKKEAKPTTLTLYGDKKFSDLFRLGSFVYAVKDPIAGLSHFGDLLFAMMNPIRLFEGRNAILESPRGKEQIKEINKRALAKASNLLEIGGLDYMKACFEFARDQAEGQIPILIVLGEQLEERDVNCEPYNCRGFATICDKENNVHQYTTNQTAAKSGVFADIDIYHINMKAFENAQIDSADIEKLYEIYKRSFGNHSPRPLLIHCTDGMDRSGGLALAFQLFHNWGRIFTSLNASEIVENIIREHEAMQQQRGPSFCTAAAKRIHGAVLLAGIMKAVQKAKELIVRNDHLDPALNGKDYLQQLYILEEMNNEEESELFKILKERQALEKLYFEEFSPEINHPQIDMFIIDSIFNGDFLSVKDREKEDLDQRFLYLKMNYKNQGFDHNALKSLVSLKCDVELYAVTRKINSNLSLLEESEDKHSLLEKTAKINSSEDNKHLKLKRKKVLYQEIHVTKLYSSIDTMIPEFSDGTIDSLVHDYYSLKKTLTQNFKEAQIMEPNVKKIENLVRKLDEIQKKLGELKNRDKELSYVAEKTRAGSLRLETSPRSRRGSLFALKLVQTTDAPQDDTPPSTSPRSKLSSLLSVSPKGSRRGSRVVQSSEQAEKEPSPDEATAHEPPLTQSGNLSASVSRFFKQLSPRGSRRASTLVNSSQDELTSSSTRVPPPDFSPAPVVETEEFQQALTNLAEAQNKQAVSPRAERKFSLSPRGSRKREPSAEHRRKSLAADTDIGDQISADLAELGF